MSKINMEMAEAEFLRFGESMDLDFEENEMDEESLKDFIVIKKRLVASIMKGNLVVNENGEPVFTPVSEEEKNPITFCEPSGATLQAMDKKKKGEDIGKTFAMMSDMTQTSSGLFSKMKNRNFKICQGIFTLFLA